MLINLIKSYLVANQREVEKRSDHLASLKRIAQASRSEADFLAENSKMSQGFIKISRVAQGEPVTLFGADVPSHAFNRIEIFAGEDQGEDRVPGKCLMSFLLNEQNLTELVMKPNRGDAVSWATTESANGWRLGPYQSALQTERDLFEGQLDDSVRSAKNPLRVILPRLKAAKLPLSAKLRDEVSRDLKRIDPSANILFAQKRLRETLGKKLVKLKLEASHTLLNLDKIRLAKEQLLLSPPAPEQPRSHEEIQHERLTNPILNGVLERYDENEAAALREVVQWAIRDFAQAHGVLDFDPARTDAFGSVLGKIVAASQPGDRSADLNAYAQKLSRLHNRLTNPSVLDRCADFDPWKLTVSLTHRGMDRRALHSDFASASGDGVVLHINKAVAEDFFGEMKVRAGAEIFEIQMSSEEFMLALRGHPEGEAVRCTLTHVIGNNIEPVPFTTRYQQEIDASREAITSQIREARRRAAEIAEEIAGGVTSKGQLEGIMASLRELNAAFDQGIDQMERLARDGADRIEADVSAHYLDSMSDLQNRIASSSQGASLFLA